MTNTLIGLIKIYKTLPLLKIESVINVIARGKSNTCHSQKLLYHYYLEVSNAENAASVEVELVNSKKKKL